MGASWVYSLPYSRKIWREFKFGGRGWNRQTKTPQYYFRPQRVMTYTCCSALGRARRRSTQAVHIASSSLTRCQLCKFANLQLCSSTSSKRTAKLPDKRARNVCNDVIRCEAPPPNLNSANIYYARIGAKPPNLKTANISDYMVSSKIGVLNAYNPSQLLTLGTQITSPFISPFTVPVASESLIVQHSQLERTSKLCKPQHNISAQLWARVPANCGTFWFLLELSMGYPYIYISPGFR